MRTNNPDVKTFILCLIIIMSLSRNVVLGSIDWSAKISAKNQFLEDNQSSLNHSLKAGDDKGDLFWHRYGPWIVAGASAIPLFAVDRDIMKFSQRCSLHSRDADNFFWPVYESGQGYECAIAIPFLVHGLIYKKNRSMVVAGELVAGLAAEIIFTKAFKILSGRLRPYQSASPSKFFRGGRSFFSGDVSTSFTFATIMAKNYPRQNLGFIGIHHEVPLIPIFLYSAGGLVACQRLYSDNHWPSDVYYGALAGYAVGSIVEHYGKKTHLKGFTFQPGHPPLIAACFMF